MSATMTTTLRDAVMKLAVSREELAQRKAAWKARYERFLEEYATESALVDASHLTVAACEADVRGLALVAHETGAALCGGVSVVKTKRYEIDEERAFLWALDTKLCLIPQKLDVKAVQKLATVQPLPFVTVLEAPAVRIASDLLATISEDA